MHARNKCSTTIKRPEECSVRFKAECLSSSANGSRTFWFLAEAVSRDFIHNCNFSGDLVCGPYEKTEVFPSRFAPTLPNYPTPASTFPASLFLLRINTRRIHQPLSFLNVRMNFNLSRTSSSHHQFELTKNKCSSTIFCFRCFLGFKEGPSD